MAPLQVNVSLPTAAILELEETKRKVIVFLQDTLLLGCHIW